MEQKCETTPGVHLAVSDLQPAIKEMVNLIRRHRLDYDQLIYVTRTARKRLSLSSPTTRKKRLPKALTPTQLDAFLAAASKGNPQHEIIFRLLYATGLRVAELCNLKRTDIDLSERTVRVYGGKGDKDRVTLISDDLRLPLDVYMRSTAGAVYLFESNRRTKYTTRRIEQLATHYGNLAGIEDMTPHILRHSLLTALSSAGMTDRQIMQISGHASVKALEVYQHLALSDVKEEYQAAMRRR
jgi:integrase/recombinase XerD